MNTATLTNDKKRGKQKMNDVLKHLGDSADDLLKHQCTTIPKDTITLPGSDLASNAKKEAPEKFEWQFTDLKFTWTLTTASLLSGILMIRFH